MKFDLDDIMSISDTSAACARDQVVSCVLLVRPSGVKRRAVGLFNE